ncbi:hypothetical protein AB0M43_38495 [Longispora sp. NPDC051575]|uniref:hypothetical protein n=1 Tax=Longispora sp. NPDC051575 TaxID=3154943 RepID=UPI00341DFD15
MHFALTLLLAVATVGTALALSVLGMRRSWTCPLGRVELDPAVCDLIHGAARDGVIHFVVQEFRPSTVTTGLALTVHATRITVPHVYIEGHGIGVYGRPAADTIAAVLMAIRDETGMTPHAHFPWPEESMAQGMLRRLFMRTGDTAPAIREILRRAESNSRRRPVVHMG